MKESGNRSGAYALFHMAVYKRDTPFLTRASGLKLHTAAPNHNNYAHGWIVMPDHPFAEGDALAHSGTNLYWFSVIWLDLPELSTGLQAGALGTYTPGWERSRGASMWSARPA